MRKSYLIRIACCLLLNSASTTILLMKLNQKITVAIAIIYQEGKFLLQLRDNIPNIVHPGCWALFGGHLETGETPESALKREIKEEINYDVANFTKFACYQDQSIIRHVYSMPLTVEFAHLTLGEGWDFALVSPQTIIDGSCYSQKAKAVKPFADIHRQILLDFLSSENQKYKIL